MYQALQLCPLHNFLRNVYMCLNQEKGDAESSGKVVPLGIGEDTQIKKAIIDKNARIGKNVMVNKIPFPLILINFCN